MNRPALVIAFVAVATASLLAQESSQNSPYQGTSNPPPDDSIITDSGDQPQAKPPAGHPMTTPPDAASQPSAGAPQPAVPPASVTTGSDKGVAVPASGALPTDLTTGAALSDPDADIVHPAPLGPGEIREGTMIRVRLLNDLSSAFTEQGQTFRTRVASDVLAGGNVVIPTGA